MRSSSSNILSFRTPQPEAQAPPILGDCADSSREDNLSQADEITQDAPGGESADSKHR